MEEPKLTDEDVIAIQNAINDLDTFFDRREYRAIFDEEPAAIGLERLLRRHAA